MDNENEPKPSTSQVETMENHQQHAIANNQEHQQNSALNSEQISGLGAENRNSPEGKESNIKPDEQNESHEEQRVRSFHTAVGGENKQSVSPMTDGTVERTLSRETTDISLDLEGPSHDQKEAQFLLVKCQLCSENMRMPKLLQCLHSFCEQCLEGFVKKCVDRSKTTTITCPLCHSVVLTSRGRINAREYVESLPTSTLVSTVLSKRASRTRLCSVCKSDENPAVSWCGYCALAFCEEHVQYHKQLTTLKHRHPTILLDDVGKNSIMFPYQKCQFHKNQDLHLFCKEEWTPCCHICRKMLHKYCDVQKGSVLSLSVAATKVKESKQAKNLKKRLDTLREEADTITEDRIKNLDELELQLRLGRESISTIRTSINEHLDRLEDELHDELTEIYERTRIDLEEERDKAEIKLRTVVHFQNMLENIHIHSPDTQAISELSHIRDQTRNMENEVHNFQRKARTFEISITTYAEYFRQISRMGSLQRREIPAYKVAPIPQPAKSKTTLYKAGSKSTL